jgi:hypothetical protein
MNDEVLNEIENVAPTITEAAKKLFAEQDAELRLQPPETDQGLGGPETTDQSQSATAVNNQNQNVESQPVEERGPTRAELKERLLEKRKRGERITFADTFGGASADLRNPMNWTNYPSAMGAGYTDFLIDTVNLIPGVNLPKLPQYESKTLQGIRQMSSIIIPVLNLSNFLKRQGASAHAKTKWALGDKRLMKWFGNAGIDAAAGAVVDQVIEFNEFDDNATGSLKKMWPSTYGWIPDDITTLDTDSPDVKRMKNRNEGIGLSFFGDFLLGATKIARALKGVDDATKWVPKNERAKEFVKRTWKYASGDAGEEMTVNNAKRVQEFNEIGKRNLSLATDINGNINLDQPIKGIHDIYDDYEVGFRSSDPGGIVGASVDVVRINNNIDSVHGRVGSVFSDSALKNGLNLDDAGLGTMKELSKDLQLDIEWHSPNGAKITHAQVVKNGEDLAAALYDMDVDEMKRVLDNFTGVDVDSGTRVLNSEGYVGVFNAIKKYFDDYMNMDLARAQAYVGKSLADQVTDMAEGARLMNGTAAVQNAQEQILDRLQYLMNIKGQTSYARGRALNMINLWNRMKKLDFKNYGGKKKVMENAVSFMEGANKETLDNLKNITKESKDTIDTIRQINAERPEMLKPLMLAYEFTDGKVNNIAELNRYFQNSTGIMKKAFIDFDPEYESMFMQGVWSNIYNSTLSAIGTPLKAAASNMALMIERPIATLGGAIMQRDMDIMRRASYMYFGGIGDTMQKSFDHMRLVFRKAWTDPNSVGYVMREDIAIKNEGQIQSLRAFAEAQEQSGNFGPSGIVDRIEAMNDIANHPWLRFSANSMTAFDGFTRAFIGAIETRGKVYDDLIKRTGKKKLTAKGIERLNKKYYREMFDESGMITDKGVEFASKEIAMNLDSPAVDSFNSIIKRFPLLRPFFMFPRTATNMIKFTGSHNPMGLFFKQLNEFGEPFNNQTISNVRTLLEQRGITGLADDKLEMAYETIRAELKGRKAIGAFAVSGAAFMFTSDRLHGNGIYDKTRQRTRNQLGWQPRSFKGLDGKWYSYEGLGAISDWIAVTADIMDNFDTPLSDGTLDTGGMDVAMSKMMYVLAANLTNKTFLAGIEPLYDVLQGNPSATARWTSSFGSSLIPGSGLRNELSRLLSPGIKEVENEFTQLIANRNPGMKGNLPAAYDWVDGGKVREPDSFWTRAWNAYSPVFKVRDGVSPEKQFLIDIEFDGRPQLNTDGNGVELSPTQRSDVTRLMGEDKIFKKKIREIMNSADGKRFREAFKQATESGAEIDRKQFILLHQRIREALADAQAFAIGRISDRNNVEQKQYYNKKIQEATQLGDVEEILRLQDRANRL